MIMETSEPDVEMEDASHIETDESSLTLSKPHPPMGDTPSEVSENKALVKA